jgi:hypothetical protein
VSFTLTWRRYCFKGYIFTSNGIIIPKDGRNGFKPPSKQAADIQEWINWAIAGSPEILQLFSDIPVAAIVNDSDSLRKIGHTSDPGRVGKYWIIKLSTDVYDNVNNYGPSGGKKGKILMQIGHELGRIKAAIITQNYNKKEFWLDIETQYFNALLSLGMDNSDKLGAKNFYDNDKQLPF